MVAKKFVSFAANLGFILTAGVLSGCSHFSDLKISPRPRSQTPELITNWVKPTVEGQFKVHRKMNRTTPVVTETLVVQGNNLEDLVAFDRATGREVWRQTRKGGIEMGLTHFKDRLYVTANDGTVAALNIHTGAQIWSFPTSSENLSEPVLDTASGHLYFQNAQNIVYCLDAETGKQNWIYSRLDSTLITIRGAATPTVHGGLVFVGFSDGTFTALNANTGQVVWDQGLNRNNKFRDVDAQAAVYRDLVVVSGYDDKVYALDQKKGTVVWSYPVGSNVAVSLVGDQMYVGAGDGSIVKLKADSGEVIWKHAGVKGIPTEVVPFQDLVMFGESQGKLKFLSQDTGKLVGSFEPGRGIFSKPLWDEARSEIYFISGEAWLYNLKFIRNPWRE